MGKVNLANLKKTIYYLKRNGIFGTIYAVQERMADKSVKEYEWVPLPENELKIQREKATELSEICVSIVVPTYRTPRFFLLELIQSVQSQSYSNWELVLADASEDDSVKDVVDEVSEERIKYLHLEKNEGISVNTNQGIALAKGDYVGLLDHDDILTPNALYEMVSEIEQKKQQGIELELLYSDEDKCDQTGTRYFEPHLKMDFNLDLLFSNNYICHFMMMKKELIQELRLREEFDGAQDFDLMLRAVDRLYGKWEKISHVSKVLYHWRCHSSSTAENPGSKMYAYEAGRRAVQDFANHREWKVTVKNTNHLGFYRLHYERPVFEERPEIGAVGYPIIQNGRISGGIMNLEGKPLYAGLRKHFSGYMHRAALQQDAAALDIRNIEVRPQLQYLFQELFQTDYVVRKDTNRFDITALPEGTNPVEAGVRLSEAIRRKGFLLLYFPNQD